VCGLLTGPPSPDRIIHASKGPLPPPPTGLWIHDVSDLV